MSVWLEEKTAKSRTARVPQAEREVLIDNDMTRITRWRFDPGTQTGWHHHAHDYVTIQESGGALQLESADGEIKRVDYTPGRTVAYQAPIEHNATNISDEEVRVLEIEYKR